jgi:hypothetical protein
MNESQRITRRGSTVYGVTEYLMIIHEDAKARPPSTGSKRTEDPSNRTAQEVLHDPQVDPSEHGSSENWPSTHSGG